MNRTAVGVVAVLAVAVAAGAGYWFGQQGSAPAPQVAAPAAPGGGQAKGGAGGGAAQAAPVEVANAVTEPMPQTITTVGSLRSDESVTIRPEVAGRIAYIGFREGQPVRKGDVLVKLDASINEAEVQQARANLKLARSKYERAVDLAKSNFISGQARDEAENNLRVGEAALALVEAKLAKTEIRAPFSGVIGLRAVSIGDYVKEAQDLVNLESIDPLKVDFRLPEVHLRQVQAGQTLQVTLDALPGTTFEGRVFAVNPLVDAAGRAVVVRAQVKNTDASLRPGMFARVRLITANQGDAIVVPEQALVPQGTEQYVFKVVDGKAQRARVEVGQRRTGKVEVRSGVAAGDVIVTAGQVRLRDGMPVMIANRGANGAAPNDGSPPASVTVAPKDGPPAAAPAAGRKS
ncbi:MAG TPA: efflux RND transporter periplasmic adaptor subunit [Casimicrobiaceae bacterium]|nr:efflux RND transporter periplasmic adaptor subunit [Casimicrobiaceae bacterium]